MRIKIKEIKKEVEGCYPYIGKEVLLKGWIRTLRAQKKFTFLEMNDGSTLSNIQVIVDSSVEHYTETLAQISTGASVAISGIVKESPGKGQHVEIHAQEVTLIGECKAEDYPLQKKRHSFEFLRTIAHLRPRTNTIGAVSRVRNRLAYATHQFFQKRDFLYLHTPIITAADCEGAGELFRVTTLNGKDSLTEDTQRDFFSKPTYLTVSGQLNAEIYACALSDVYTFGPTFRAENSNTSRHLAEFWMIEPEMAFADLHDDMSCAEEYLKYLVSDLLENCKEDMTFFDQYIEKGLLERLEGIVSQEFVRLPYTEAVEILQSADRTFSFPVSWGKDLQSEHERYLTEVHFCKPVIVYDYPKEIKAFYMRGNTDNKTVAAMDVLVPKIGEIIGGSQREERLEVLEARLDALDLPKDEYWWYLELRKYGSVPHAGFGLGFERLVQFVTGMENIRDVIPFPRYPEHADF